MNGIKATVKQELRQRGVRFIDTDTDRQQHVKLDRAKTVELIKALHQLEQNG